MAIFCQRHRAYQGGVLLLFLAFLFALYGVVAPGWIRSEGPAAAYTKYEQLWWSCKGLFKDCETVGIIFFLQATATAVKVLCVVGLMMLFGAVMSVIYREFADDNNSKTRVSIVNAILSGVMLFIACMVFVSEKDEIAIFGKDKLSTSFVTFGPSFAMTLTSSLMAIIAGVTMALFVNRPGPSAQTMLPLQGQGQPQNNYGYVPLN